MKLTEALLPPGYRFRELWLPQNIIPDSSLLRSVHGGHDLFNITGALLGSTVDGLEMRGAERITITDHVDIHIADNLTVVLPAFILQGTFPDDYAANMGLMNLNNGAVIARLNQATGALDFIFNDVDGGADETVSTTKVSWAADTLWQVAFTFENNGTGVVSVRLFINGVAENTNDQVDQVITVPAGNTVLGEDLTTFFTGKFQRKFLVYDTAVLTEAQLYSVYLGGMIPTNLKAYLPMDHPGRGLTMPDRSAGGNCSGTISGTWTSIIWDFGTVKQPVLNFDGLNDAATSTGGIAINGDITVIWAGRLKANYAPSTLGEMYFMRLFIEGANTIDVRHEAALTGLRFRLVIGGGVVTLIMDNPGDIDDYLIAMLTLTQAGDVNLFQNGTREVGAIGLGAMSAVIATAYIGRSSAATGYDVSTPLLIGLVEGALSIDEVKAVSRLINNQLGLGLSI